MRRSPEENPFVFGEIIDETKFVDRQEELRNLVRDLADGQKVFLLSPRRFGKSSLVHVAFLQLAKRHIRTASVTVSSYVDYAQFLEKFAEKVIRCAGPLPRVRDWAGRFWRRVEPSVGVDPVTGEVSLTIGRDRKLDPGPLAAEVFALPGELARNGGFRMAICLDEFQQIAEFDGRSVENSLRDAVQRQREVGYVFAGSQPSIMQEMLGPKRPFYKSGPLCFLDKIPAEAWREFIAQRFAARGREMGEEVMEELLRASDLIPYDVQRIAHELWDQAESEGKRKLEKEDVSRAVDRQVTSQSAYYEQLWDQLSARQRAVLQAVALRGSDQLLSQNVRETLGLGAASTVQKALSALDGQDILERYAGEYFFLDSLLAHWIRRNLR